MNFVRQNKTNRNSYKGKRFTRGKDQSGKTNGDELELTTTKRNGKQLTQAEIKMVKAEQARVIKWLNDIKAHESFGKEWSLFVLHEIVLQCMGKLPTTIYDYPVKIVNMKEAVKAVKLGAEISGALMSGAGKFNFHFGKNLLGSDQESEENKPMPKSDKDRAIEVFDILSEAGVFQIDESQGGPVIEMEEV